MTSVQNLLQQLSGNRKAPLLFVLFLFVACSAQKRVSNAPTTQQSEEKPVQTKPEKASAHSNHHDKQSAETPLKQVVFRGEVFTLPSNTKEQPLNIAVVLPFCLDKFGRVNEQIREIVMDYFEGVELALDALVAQYPFIKVEVFDSQNDSAVVRSIVQKDFLKQAHLVIGPVFEQEWKPMEQHCALYSIPLISPLRFQPKANRTSAPVFNMASPDSVKHYLAAKALFAQNPNARFVFVSDNSLSNMEAKRAFVRAAAESKKVLQHTQLEGLKTMVDATNEWIVIAPLKTENSAHHLLNFSSGKKNVQIVGSEEWFDFTIIPFSLWEKSRLLFYSNNHIRQEDPDVVVFNEKYKEKFGGIPGKLSYIGFDQGYFFVEALLAFGTQFAEFVSGYTFPAMHNSFRIVPNAQDMYENKHINLLELVDFELFKTK
jgi:hypothetical protein